MINVAVVGAGKGGNSIIKAFNGIEGFKIVGICDSNPTAPGISTAQGMGISVYHDLLTLLKIPGMDVIIEATGSEKVKEIIMQNKPHNTSVVDSKGANVMMVLTEEHEKMIRRINNKKEAFKTSASMLLKTYDSGVLYFCTDLKSYDFVLNEGLDIAGAKVGESISNINPINQCVRSGQEVIGLLEKEIYGMPLKIWVTPIFSDESGEVEGTYGVLIPKIHDIHKSFHLFAPIVANSQSEGALVLATDKERITHRLGSDKFDVTEIKVGMRMRDEDVGKLVMKKANEGAGKDTFVVVDMPSNRYKIVRCVGVPLLDEDTKEVIGSFGIFTPRLLPHSLQEMAAKLGGSSHEISSVMQEIAASASQINLNQSEMANNIQEIKEISERIYQILKFITSVADQTKMLGLNAAIEAARAGEHGRGFGVVAEEIKVLSDQSKDTAEQIGKLTREIENKIFDISQTSEGNVKQSQEQAAATQEITASVMEMASLAEKLQEMAASL